jgi:hypothetical protein
VQKAKAGELPREAGKTEDVLTISHMELIYQNVFSMDLVVQLRRNMSFKSGTTEKQVVR